MLVTMAQQLLKQATQFHRLGELQKARDIYTKILESFPKQPDALHLYGLVCHQQGQHQEAIEYIHKAVEQVPNQPVLRNNLGDALREAGEYEEALTQLKIALKLRPDYAGAHQNLASVHSRLGDYDAALFHARKSVDIDAGKPEAWFNLGLIQLDHVLLNESAGSFRKALNLRPVYPTAATSLLYTLNLLPGANPDVLAKEHKTVAASVFSPVQTEAKQVRPGTGGQNERIRIAYMSGDFCAHAVNYFFEPVLEFQDKTRFETFCYSDVVHPDQTTQRLKKFADHWCDIGGWEDDMVIEQVKSDRIDILVDLAGFTNHNRLGVFAHRVAPRQITWLGFPNTTGLDCMDYRVVDQYTTPVEEVSSGSEQLIRLPRGFACFRPPPHAPAVQPAPVERNGFVTLGCLHKLEKLNEELIGVWAGILKENPSSRLLLARDQLDEWQQQRLLASFQRNGIAAERLKLIHFQTSGQTFFDLFAEIDIMLDSFPWSGHTLACCALWMGVPVVSLYGDRHAGRMVASVLNLLGMDELVAEDTESYARLVKDLCSDQDRLIRYRTELRNQFEQSPLRDEKGFTRDLENEIRIILKF